MLLEPSATLGTRPCPRQTAASRWCNRPRTSSRGWGRRADGGVAARRRAARLYERLRACTTRRRRPWSAARLAPALSALLALVRPPVGPPPVPRHLRQRLHRVGGRCSHDSTRASVGSDVRAASTSSSSSSAAAGASTAAGSTSAAGGPTWKPRAAASTRAPPRRAPHSCSARAATSFGRSKAVATGGRGPTRRGPPRRRCARARAAAAGMRRCAAPPRRSSRLRVEVELHAELHRLPPLLGALDDVAERALHPQRRRQPRMMSGAAYSGTSSAPVRS